MAFDDFPHKYPFPASSHHGVVILVRCYSNCKSDHNPSFFTGTLVGAIVVSFCINQHKQISCVFLIANLSNEYIGIAI